MAYLLGAAAVMESLQTDVRDVQATVLDVISRVGPVNVTSWKFPDKQSCDIDIEDLLDLYSYSDDDEERQVAHIALYELVIDRLVLLLQSMSVYTDRLLKTAKCESAAGQGTSTSVGLISKRFWSRLTQINTAMKQSASEKGSLARKVSELETDVSRLNADLQQKHTNRPRTSGGVFGGMIPPNRAEMIMGQSLDPSMLKKLGVGYARDEYNKSCQTSETAFTPCDSCCGVQKCMRQTGDMVVGICQQQQIPSCLQKFRPQVQHLDWFTGSDVARWAAEQNKDLQRISKLTATIKPMKDDLSETHSKCDKLQKRVSNFDRDMKQERDTKAALTRQYEQKMKELESQHIQTLELEQQQQLLLRQNKEELEKVLDKHRTELEEQKLLLQQLESSKQKYAEELSTNKANMSEVHRLEAEMGGLQSRLDTITKDMEQSARELRREQAINKSAAKQSQSLKSKQEALLQRVDALDEENGELKEQVATLEEEKETFEESIETEQRERTVLQRSLKEKESEIEHIMADKESLEQTIGTLETSLEKLTDKLEEAKERERLIVEYPDINGPVNPNLSGTGDIVEDMQNQVKANSIRIGLLESQNEGLRNSIHKLQLLQQQQEEPDSPQPDQYATYIQSNGPQPLWNPNHLEKVKKETQMKNVNKNTNNSNAQGQYMMSGIHDNNYRGVKTFQFEDIPVQPKPQTGFGSRPPTGTNKPRPESASEFIVSKAKRPMTGPTKKPVGSQPSSRSRPSSGKSAMMAPVNTTSIGAYMQLKRAGKLNMDTDTKIRGARPGSMKSGVTIPSDDQSSTTENYTQQDNFTCDKCDKMYSRARDLEIHKSYCTALFD